MSNKVKITMYNEMEWIRVNVVGWAIPYAS